MGTQAAKKVGGKILNKVIDVAALPSVNRAANLASSVAGTIAFAATVAMVGGATAAALPVIATTAAVVTVVAGLTSIFHSGAKVKKGKSTWKEERTNVGFAAASITLGAASGTKNAARLVASVYSWGLSNAGGVMGLVGR